MSERQQAIVVILVGFLAVGVGASGSVAADSVGPLDNGTNISDSTDSLETTTNETVALVESVSSKTTDGHENTSSLLDRSKDPVESPSDTEEATEAGKHAIDMVKSSPDRSALPLLNEELPTGIILSSRVVSTPATVTGARPPELPLNATSDGANTATEPVTDTELNRRASNASNASIGPSPDGLGPELPASPLPVPAVIGLGTVFLGAVVRQMVWTQTGVHGLSARADRAISPLVRMYPLLRYSRYDDSDPLKHEHRAAMIEAIDDSPGVYLRELSDRLGVSRSTLRHHVRVLEDEGLIAATRVRGRRRCYPANAESIELVAALNDESTAPIVDALARLGRASVSELADVIDRDKSTVTYHLNRLKEDGVVVRNRDGRAVVNRLSPQARDALVPTGEAATEHSETEEATYGIAD